MRRRTILVVEDETAVRRMVCEMLRRMGYKVLEASGPDRGEAAPLLKPLEGVADPIPASRTAFGRTL